MKIRTQFEIMPDLYAKAAPTQAKTLGVPVISFPFTVEFAVNQIAKQSSARVRYLHWAFTDPDSIPVCGFEWIHWTVANVPVSALAVSGDNAQSKVYEIPEDFTHYIDSEDALSGVVQGKTSQASRFVGGTDPAITMHYNGPQPPDVDHEYWLRVWATSEPLTQLHTGFWFNELTRALRLQKQAGQSGHSGQWLDCGELRIIGRA